jgi:hypothetical protein
MRVRASATPRPRCGVWRAAGRNALVAALLLSGASASAQPIQGFYVGGATGGTWPHLDLTRPATADPASSPPASASATRSVPETGTAGAGSIGYGLGNGLRFEVEGNGLDNRLRAQHGP